MFSQKSSFCLKNALKCIRWGKSWHFLKNVLSFYVLRATFSIRWRNSHLPGPKVQLFILKNEIIVMFDTIFTHEGKVRWKQKRGLYERKVWRFRIYNPIFNSFRRCQRYFFANLTNFLQFFPDFSIIWEHWDLPILPDFYSTPLADVDWYPLTKYAVTRW